MSVRCGWERASSVLSSSVREGACRRKSKEMWLARSSGSQGTVSSMGRSLSSSSPRLSPPLLEPTVGEKGGNKPPVFRRLPVSRKQSQKMDLEQGERAEDRFLKPLRLQRPHTNMPHRFLKEFRDTVKEEGYRVSALARTPYVIRRKPQRSFVTTQEEVDVPSYNAWMPSLYAAVQAPRSLACATRVMTELSRLRPDFRPRSVLDFGAGVGSATVAAAAVFSEGKWDRPDGVKDVNSGGWYYGMSLRRATLIERSDGMCGVGQKLLKRLFTTRDRTLRREVTHLRMEWLRGVRDVYEDDRFDVVVASRAFEEIGGGIQTLQAATELLWSITGKYLVVIESGDLDGFARIKRIRSLFVEDDTRESGTGIRGARIVAPCMHAKQCPMENQRLSCTFAQQYHIPEFSRVALKRQDPDGRAWFSYLVLEKTEDEAGEDGEGRTEEEEETPRRRSRRRPASLAEQVAESGYGRIVRPPIKRQKHVHVDLCSRQGQLERVTIGKSRGRTAYATARKCLLGDILPVGPDPEKAKSVPSPGATADAAPIGEHAQDALRSLVSEPSRYPLHTSDRPDGTSEAPPFSSRDVSPDEECDEMDESDDDSSRLGTTGD